MREENRIRKKFGQGTYQLKHTESRDEMNRNESDSDDSSDSSEDTKVYSFPIMLEKLYMNYMCKQRNEVNGMKSDKETE